ncbi:MAG: IS3 family transposase, partial [Clostridium sp.]
IKQYMIYYNNYRYQWNLEKMTPVQYRNHLLNCA